MGKYFNHKKTKSGYLICVVPMCQTKRSTTTLKTFEFPSDLKRRSQWISAIVEATLRNEEKSSLEDLYALENRRMELEMEISGALGDHSYVCARHFLPTDIIVHPNVCRLTSNAVPSIFSNYSTDLPRQFFKRVCQTARSIVSVEDPNELIHEDFQEQISYENDSQDSNNYLQEVTVYDASDEELNSLLTKEHFLNSAARINTNLCSEYDAESSSQVSRSVLVISRGTNTKLKYTGVSNTKLTRNKLRKRIRLLETRCKNLKKKLTEIEDKHSSYNIKYLERDAESNNEEAIFLLDMLKSYNAFEDTRREILTSQNSIIESEAV